MKPLTFGNRLETARPALAPSGPGSPAAPAAATSQVPTDTEDKLVAGHPVEKSPAPPHLTARTMARGLTEAGFITGLFGGLGTVAGVLVLGVAGPIAGLTLGGLMGAGAAVKSVAEGLEGDGPAKAHGSLTFHLGSREISIGLRPVSHGANSVAIGLVPVAEGDGAHAYGVAPEAEGKHAGAWGLVRSGASGEGSYARGIYLTQARGKDSNATGLVAALSNGENSQAKALVGTLAFGKDATARGIYFTLAQGEKADAKGAVTVLGIGDDANVHGLVFPHREAPQ